MINVIATIHTRPGARPQYLEILERNVPAVLAEDGCLGYAPCVDAKADLPPQILDEQDVVLVEAWESLDALRAHLGSPHMLAYKEAVKDLVESVSLRVLQPA
jgi:quinol monooxygenase YgiN